MRAITSSPDTFDRSVMMSSLMPSEKKAWSASRLMLSKASTAMEGLSSGGAGPARDGAPPSASAMVSPSSVTTQNTSTGRSMFLTFCSPRLSMRIGTLSRTWSAAAREMQMPPGSASASSRAATLTPSP